MNDSVQIKGASISQYGSGLYYGTSGSGYPYNSSNSLGKLSGNVVDYAPLTAILSMPLSINFTSPTPANNTNTTNTSVIINVSINTSSLNNFIWNWNGTNYSLYNNSIVLMMNFDNNSNIGDSASQATDVSIYGNNGTITNALWSNTGVHGGSIRFNGAGDYITLPTNKIFYDILAPHATTFWLYINTYAGNGYPTVLNLLATQGMYYAIYASNNGTYEGISITETSGASFRAAGISGGLVGSWNHVAIVFDGVDRTQASSWKIYLNGVPQTVLAGGSWTTFANNILGTDDASATHTINGNLDDLTIWNRSLTASEVQQLYRSSFQKIYPNYWQFTANESNLTLRNYTYYAYANDANSNSGQTETRYINIMSPSNTPPVITNVATLGAQNPVEKGLSTFSINFTVNDNDGNATINVSSAKVFVNISGLFRNSTSCSGSAINSTAINVSCNVSLQYYDPAGLWSINVSISDNSGDYAENITSTFTYNELASISLSANNLNFGLLTTGAANQTTNPLIINNSGNVNFVNISIKAFELANGTSYIGVGNFTVNVSNATGMMLANNTLMDIAGSYINRNNDTMQTNQTLYFYVSVPSSLPSKNYYSVSGWMIVANK